MNRAVFKRLPALSRDVSPSPAVDMTKAQRIENPVRLVGIDYTNWRGERRIRTIKPIEVEWGCTQWHPVHQWLLRAKDMDDGGKVKLFAMRDIHAWGPAARSIDP